MKFAAQIHPEWRAALANSLASEQTQQLAAFLEEEEQAGKQIFPPKNQWLRALEAYGPDDVRLVILGQDPYHGAGQAEGLAFSVPETMPMPPSLKNIYKELASDIGFVSPGHGHLQHWVEQGVLLLNSVLTVEAGMAASHQKRGWEQFTDAIIQHLGDQQKPIVFILWGAYAQKKASFVQSIDDGGRHLLLKSAHPSPLSAHNGFLGCRHFSRSNAFLSEHGLDPIDWQVPLDNHLLF